MLVIEYKEALKVNPQAQGLHYAIVQCLLALGALRSGSPEFERNSRLPWKIT